MTIEKTNMNFIVKHVFIIKIMNNVNNVVNIYIVLTTFNALMINLYVV